VEFVSALEAALQSPRAEPAAVPRRAIRT
jgi:hypothetical protein